MTKIIAEDKARGGSWGWHGLRLLIAALLLAFAACGAAEIYGEMTSTSPTVQQDNIPKG